VVGGDTEALEESARLLAGSPSRLELAWSLAELGAAHRRAGRRRDAQPPLREALDLAGRAGATALAERCRHELLLAGARPRRSAIRGVDALTAGELRVAELAAAGRTNRQIAEALFVTRKTVDSHLRGVYRKLGTSVRAELGALLGEHGAG
jgi:DNA-binding CsgD family transcriptional regulator